MRAVVVGFLMAACGLGWGQAPAGGSISGHVFLGDTDGPARFARVMLKPVVAPDPKDDLFTVIADGAIVNMQEKGGKGSADDDKALAAARGASAKFLAGVGESLLVVTVGMDGNYRFTHVPPGSYYVHVKDPGYVDTLARFTGDELASDDPAVRKRVANELTMVSLGGNEPVRVDLRLERGAAVAGRVSYDDGSPAMGWTVRAMAKRTATTKPALEILGMDLSFLDVSGDAATATTDDGGRYRISGLPGGEYVVEAKMVGAALDASPFQAAPSSAGSLLSVVGGVGAMTGLRMAVYLGDTTRLGEAKSVVVKGGEERGGLDIAVSLRAARTVSGAVVAGTDGHAVSGGTVVMTGRGKDGSEDASVRLTATVREDGGFRFDLVPGAGSYTLRTVRAGDRVTTGTMKILGHSIAEQKVKRGYGVGSLVIEVGDEDVTGVRVVVPEE